MVGLSRGTMGPVDASLWSPLKEIHWTILLTSLLVYE